MEEYDLETATNNVKPIVNSDEHDAAAADDEESVKTMMFTQLKSYCLELLSLHQNPNKTSINNKNSLTLLQNLLQFLRESSSSSLQPFLDYVLFPLLLLFDASVDCRSKQQQSKNVRFDYDDDDDVVKKKKKEVSDAVAEGVVLCLEELLIKCRLLSVNQMVVMLKKLTSGALLSPIEASEEFRLGVIKCFRALLLNLDSCSGKTCSCKQVLGYPALSKRNILRVQAGHVSKSEECLLAFFQSQTASAAIGHWLSLLLKASDSEAARGHRGSAKLRIEAFWTLRVLVAKVGTAEALAFFLPGVVSQFAKVLHVSKTMISGAAGSVEAIDQAIRALAEYIMIVLRDDANISCIDDINRNNMDTLSESILENLRHLPTTVQHQSNFVEENNITSDVARKKDTENMFGSLQINRTKEWIDKTAVHVNKLLIGLFPHICVHPAKKAREGLLAAIKGLLSECTYSLKASRLMLMECLCALVCDSFEDVSSDAQRFLEVLFSSNDKHHVNSEVTEIFNRLMEKLPKLVLGSDAMLAISYAQKLLVVIYFSGPEVVADHLLASPITAARFLDVFALCFGHNSAFAGSLEKHISARPTSTGYLSSVAELRAGIGFTSGNGAITKTGPWEASQLPKVQDQEFRYAMDNVRKDYELPRMPPWFLYVGSEKLYQALAGILRLVGLSSIAEVRGGGRLPIVTDIPLGYLRKLISEVRKKEYSGEIWRSWYNRTGSGQLLRQASTVACMLNEMIFGASNQALQIFMSMFKSNIEKEGKQGSVTGYDDGQPCKLDHSTQRKFVWMTYHEGGSNTLLIECIGTILHEYLSPEIWNLPIEHKPSLNPSDDEAGSLHFFNDTAMLHQLMIEGIGIFNLCLGKDFAASGFLHSSLYLLLENLICSNFQIRRASDVVLHILAATSGHSTVGHLVLANSDYIIDSICRQLRHLDLNPHVPSVLAAMLSYIGVAHKILPLLEEPMRAVSLELEIIGRHQHPSLTLPFLKAVSEIMKASKHEASLLPTQANSYNAHIKSIISDLKKKIRQGVDDNINTLLIESDEAVDSNESVQLEQWESILFELNDSKRYRRTVGSISVSCLTAATPLLASANQAACLVALDIVEDGIATLAKVEEAYKIEKQTREDIVEVIELLSYYHLQDTLDAADDGADENRLLPAMNKLWPFLVVCVQNKNPVATRRCLDVVSNVIQICGGDFFSRRFHTDGQHFWNLLSASPFHKRPLSKQDKTPLQLPYRNSPYSSTEENSDVAEVSNQKVQISLLNMIANLSQNKKSASSLEAVLKKVSGLVVGIACSGVTGLHDASVNALIGLTSIDPDLIWLLLADVYYSLAKKKDLLPTPPTPDFPELGVILPPPLSSKGYLYVLYGGKSYGFDIDFASVEKVFKRLHSRVFTLQM